MTIPQIGIADVELELPKVDPAIKDRVNESLNNIRASVAAIDELARRINALELALEQQRETFRDQIAQLTALQAAADGQLAKVAERLALLIEAVR